MLRSWCWVAAHSHWVLLLIIVQHVCQDIFSVLQPLRHFGIVAVQGLVQWHRGAVTFLVHVGHVPVLRVQQNFRVVLEVNLDDLVAQAEHDRVLGSHPFLDIDGAWRVLQFVGLIQEISLNELLLLLRVIILFKVGLEVLKKSYFFLKLLWEIGEAVLGHHILLFIGCNGFSLIIVELSSAGLRNDLGGVVEKYSG